MTIDSMALFGTHPARSRWVWRESPLDVHGDLQHRTISSGTKTVQCMRWMHGKRNAGLQQWRNLRGPGRLQVRAVGQPFQRRPGGRREAALPQAGRGSAADGMDGVRLLRANLRAGINNRPNSETKYPLLLFVGGDFKDYRKNLNHHCCATY